MDEEGVRARGGLGQFFFDVKNLELPTASLAKGSIQRVSLSRTSGGGVIQGGKYTTQGVPGVGGRLSPSPAMLERASIVRVQA